MPKTAYLTTGLLVFIKDKTGYLWIGTRNGLNRYDGSRFKIFRPGKSNSIASEVIQGITGDKEENLGGNTLRYLYL